MPKKRQRKLNELQVMRLDKLVSSKKISPQRKSAMVRHVEGGAKSLIHNNEMIAQLSQGKSVTEAHKISLDKVGT